MIEKDNILKIINKLKKLERFVIEYAQENNYDNVSIGVFSKEEFIEKDSEGVLLKWLITNAQKNMMEPVLVELSEGISTAGDIPHEGEEFGFVLEGKIAILLGNTQHKCKKGEAFYYIANKPHSIINIGKGKAKFVWISTPPNF